MDSRASELLVKGYRREPLTKDECRYLLSFNEYSDESIFAYDLYTRFVREQCDNTAVLGVQIGVFTGPCTGNCRFCSFGKDHTSSRPYVMPDEVLLDYLKESYRFGDVPMVSLMTNHDCPTDTLIHYVELTRKNSPDDVKIMINTGDRTYDECVELRKAGAELAYHVCRMGEGKDTDLDPETRWQTLRNLKDAGFMTATCVEPIGQEHSLDDILDNFFKGMDMGIDTGEVALRMPVFGTPLGNLPTLTIRRYKQLMAVLGLASSWYRGPDVLNMNMGYVSGMNRKSAEFAGSPRDIAPKSELSAGHTLGWARKLLFSLGYDKLQMPDGTRIPLDVDYLIRTDSL